MRYFFHSCHALLCAVSVTFTLFFSLISTAGVNTWTGPFPRNLNLADMQALSSNGKIDGKILAVASGFADSLYTSLDGGVSWSAELAVSGVGSTPGAMGVDVQNPNFIWIADGVVANLYRSTDAGKTWAVSRGFPVVNSINVRGTEVYLATRDGVYRSQDRGVTFARVGAVGSRVAAITTTADGTVFIGLTTGVLRSTNGGVTYAVTGLINVNVNNVRAATDGTLYATAGQNLYVSLDQGNSWGISVPASKVDFGAPSSLVGLNVAPDNTLFVTINGTLAKSVDRGATWLPINGAFNGNRDIVSVAQAAAAPSTLYALNSATELLKSTDGGLQWVKSASLCASGGCGAYAVRHFYGASPIVFVGTNTIKYSTNGGVTFTDANFVGGAQPTHEIVQASASSPVFYASTRTSVYKSTNGGSTWVRSGTGLPTSNIAVSTIAVDSSNSNTLYVGITATNSTNSTLYKSLDGANSWTLAGLPLTRDITSIKSVAGKVYVASYGSGLFYSDNGGQTWSSRNVGTTTANLKRVLVDLATPNSMFIGGDKGLVYQSIDAGLNWSPINYRLPAIDVDDLILSPDGKTLHIGMSQFPNTSGYYQYTIANSVIGQTTDVYRLYSPVLQVHFYTADANEYRVLTGTPNWTGEGKIYTALTQPGSINGVPTIPLYRLYSPSLRRHLLTTDFNEYSVLSNFGWTQEGIAWHMSPQASSLTIPIYRLYSDALRRHLYTVDENEKNVLSTLGWSYEGVIGHVLRPS